MRRLQSRRWASYVKNRAQWRRALLRARARGDLRARIETAGLIGGIRYADGSILVVPPLLAQMPSQRRPRKPAKKPLPSLFRYPPGHEREGQLVMLRMSRREKAIFHSRLRVAAARA